MTKIGDEGQPGISAHLDLEGGPQGTATISLRTDGPFFVTARFPLHAAAGASEPERRRQAEAAAKSWLLEAAANI